MIAIYLGGSFTPLIIWLIFNYFHFGSFLPHNADLFYGQLEADVGAIRYFFAILADFKLGLISIPGNFGYGPARLFYEMSIPYIVFVIFFTGVGIWYFAIQGINGMRRDYYRLVATVALIFIFLFLLAYSVDLKTKNFTSWTFVLQGRYFLVAFLPASVLLFSGIIKSVRIRRPERLAAGLFFVSIFYYLASLLYTIIPRYYV